VRRQARGTPLSRRAVLELLGLGAAGCALHDLSWTANAAWAAQAGKSRIARIDVFPVRYPMRGRFKFFEGPEGSPAGRPAVLVRVTDDGGAVGWGESVPIPKWSDETLETVTTTIRHYLAPELVGRDPADIVGAHAVMDRAIAPAFSTGQPIAKAGIDIALHDLVGRTAKQHVTTLWGRAPGAPLALSWTVNPRTLDEIDGLVDAGRKQGYKHFNVKVAPDPVFDVELCRRVRKLAPDGFLWADANCGYDVETALRVAPKLADAGVNVFEAPIRPNRIAGYQALARQRALPILMDEGLVSTDELVEFIRLGMLDGVAMKPARCGGLLTGRRQIEIVTDAGLMWLASGLTDPDVSLAATLALFSSYGQARPCALNGPQFLAHSVVDAPFTPRDGQLAPPTGPGLGVIVNEGKIREIAAPIAATEAPAARASGRREVRAGGPDREHQE
jgi:L-alanine-DL-glutamate epimerase-like enolase superfamily enzyme